jgi:hypothetical protein
MTPHPADQYENLPLENTQAEERYIHAKSKNGNFQTAEIRRNQAAVDRRALNKVNIH